MGTMLTYASSTSQPLRSRDIALHACRVAVGLPRGKRGVLLCLNLVRPQSLRVSKQAKSQAAAIRLCIIRAWQGCKTYAALPQAKAEPPSDCVF